MKQREMYLGFMKKGISIMCLAYAVFVMGIWLDAPWLVCSVIILWFYSLFNVHNKANLSDEEFYALEDDYLFRTLYGAGVKGWIRICR